MASTQTILDYAIGNARKNGESHHGWFVGNFLPPHLGLHATGDVEIKWGVHNAGEGQDEWTLNRTSTTISILVRGKDRITFPDGDVILEQEGDYALWGSGVPHKWRAIEDCVVISVRWPSLPGDSVPVTDKDLKRYLSPRNL